MEGNNNSKKELTLQDLAGQIASGFERVDKSFKQVEKRFEESREHTKKLVDEKIGWLVRTTQNNFLSIEGRLDGVEGRLGGIDDKLGNIEANINKKVDRIEHKDLEIRVEKVEKKLGLKPKLKFA